MKQIKWEQWDKNSGLIRCGFAEQKKIMEWLRELGKDAHRCLLMQEKSHAVYGMKIYDENDNVEEIRLYCNTYMDDDELNDCIMNHPRNVFYTAHK